MGTTVLVLSKLMRVIASLNDTYANLPTVHNFKVAQLRTGVIPVVTFKVKFLIWDSYHRDFAPQ